MGKNRTQLSDAQKAILGANAVEEIIADEAAEAAAETVVEGTASETGTSETAAAEAVAAEAQVTEQAAEQQEAPAVEQAPEAPAATEAPEVVQQGIEDAAVKEVEPVPAAPEAPVNAAPAVVAVSATVAEVAAVKPAVSSEVELGAVARRVVSVLNDYVLKMAPRKPVTDAQITQNQISLFRALISTINDSDKDFVELMKIVLAFFEEHKNGVFHEARVFRGFDSIPLSEDERRAFQRLLNLFKLVANPQSRNLALKQVDLHASLQYAVSEQGRNRLLSFFNK